MSQNNYLDYCSVIRLDSSNLDDIIKIENSCFGEDSWSKKMFIDSFANSKNEILGYIYNNKIVSFAILMMMDFEAELINIAVLPEEQGKGIGSCMLKSLIELCEENDIDSIYLEVRESNFKAINLYKKFGFTEYGMRKNYYNKPRENAIMMCKR